MAGKPGIAHDSRVYRPADTSWHPQGKCRDADDTLFYHPEGEREPARTRRAEAAKRICRTCPVAIKCLNDARARRELYGTWGGESEDERAEWLAAHPTEKSAGAVQAAAKRSLRRPVNDGDPCKRCGIKMRTRRPGRKRKDQIAADERFHQGGGLCTKCHQADRRKGFTARWEITNPEMTLPELVAEACDGRVQEEAERQRVELLREPKLMTWRIDSTKGHLVVSGPARAIERDEAAA